VTAIGTELLIVRSVAVDRSAQAFHQEADDEHEHGDGTDDDQQHANAWHDAKQQAEAEEELPRDHCHPKDHPRL
jgi:hypothetical protein